MLEKVRSRQVDTTKHGMTYLEMKYNLLLSYCQFLSFFIVLKLEGKPVKDHPVVGKLIHIKTLLERLRPLDQKLQYQIDKLIRAAALSEVNANEEKVVEGSKAIDALQYRPNIENLQGDEEESESQDEEEGKRAYSSSDEDEEEEQQGPKKQGVFKAAKLNPVLYEDKDTKKQRREELIQKKKASRSDYVNELRREIADLPDEVHLGGMTSQKSRFLKEQDQIERLELENFKRINFTKKEIKDMRNKAKTEMQERADRFDDLKGLEDILGSRKGGRYNKGGDDQDDVGRSKNAKFSNSLSKFVRGGKAGK
jgi:hypothetical protein